MSPRAEVALIAIAFFNCAGLAILAFCALGIYRQLRTFNERSRPVLDEAGSTLATVRQTATVVSEQTSRVAGDVVRRAEHIADLSERTAERVAQRVDTTSAIIQDAISSPAINLASVRAGIGKGLEVWQELSKSKGGNGK